VPSFDHVVLDVGPEAVLRAEHRGERHAFGGVEAIDDVPEVVVYRRVVADDADAQAAKAAGAEQDVGAESHGAAQQKNYHVRGLRRLPATRAALRFSDV
jgi:hypothetical protein